EIREYSVTGIKHDSMFAHKWYIGTDNEVNPEDLKYIIDESLKDLNDDYRVERIAAIKDIFVEILPSEVFYDFLRKKGKEGGQNKFPRVLKNKILDEWTEFIKDNNKK
ncbi:MAG: GH3 auxin-responsive promoter family protein, partial [Bacteroidales bacterium]